MEITTGMILFKLRREQEQSIVGRDKVQAYLETVTVEAIRDILTVAVLDLNMIIDDRAKRIDRLEKELQA